MQNLNNKELISSLIKDDLINTKLINGLDIMGIDAGLYLLNISDAIFVLMNIKGNKKGEALFEYYLELKEEKMKDFDLKKNYDSIDVIVFELYNELKKKR